MWMSIRIIFCERRNRNAEEAQNEQNVPELWQGWAFWRGCLAPLDNPAYTKSKMTNAAATSAIIKNTTA